MALVALVDFLVPARFRLRLRLFLKKRRGLLDPEMSLVEKKLGESRNFLDIGANIGIYSLYFSRVFDNVHAFEPVSEVTRHLESANLSNVTIHSVAVSATAAELELKIPIIRGRPRPALASLEDRDGPVASRHVAVVTIDSLGLEHVDLIKVDVEGHELSVIEGARDTLSRCKPIILIEIEQRHIDRPIGDVFQKIKQLGFAGRFLENGEERDIEEFDVTKHQCLVDGMPAKEYVNNFIFLPT